MNFAPKNLALYIFFMTSFAHASQQQSQNPFQNNWIPTSSDDRVFTKMQEDGSKQIIYTNERTYVTMYTTFPNGDWSATTQLSGNDNSVNTHFIARTNTTHHEDDNPIKILIALNESITKLNEIL